MGNLGGVENTWLQVLLLAFPQTLDGILQNARARYVHVKLSVLTWKSQTLTKIIFTFWTYAIK